MTDDNLRPPHESEPGWKHDMSPQPRMIDKPVSLWRRYTLADWLFVAVCLMGAAACVYLMVAQ